MAICMRIESITNFQAFAAEEVRAEASAESLLSM